MSELESKDAILIGLGANLPSRFGPPTATLTAALERLEAEGVRVLARSSFWRTRPVPVSDQPWYVNAVAAVDSPLPPPGLLALLHRVEADFGRVRGVVNAPRLLDLDLLAHGRQRFDQPGGLRLPHPRLHERAFVLLPLAEILPDWRHPVSEESLPLMIARIPSEQRAERMEDQA